MHNNNSYSAKRNVNIGFAKKWYLLRSNLIYKEKLEKLYFRYKKFIYI